MIKKAFILGACFLLAWACSKDSGTQTVTPAKALGSYARLATHFSLDTLPGYRVLSIAQPWNGSTAVYRWVLEDSTRHCPDCVLPDSLRAWPRLKVPLRRLVVLGSAQIAFLERLGALDRIVGVGNRSYIYSPALHRRLDSLSLPAVGNGSELNLEQVLQLAPDAVLTFGMGAAIYDDYPRLLKARLPAVLTAEWMEDHPLARLEWMRFIGVLVGKEALADSLFEQSVAKYDSLSALVKARQLPRPLVLLGFPAGDNWQAGGGQSYMARLIADAGGRYVWERQPESGIYVLPLEKALQEGAPADYWLHPSSWRSRAEVQAAEGRVRMLKSWNEGKVYQHCKRLGPYGSIDFYESGVVRPELVLEDLVRLLHPGLLPEADLYYYKRLE